MGVPGSDSSTTMRKLEALGVAARVPTDYEIEELRDPDGITVQIGVGGA